MPPKKRKFESTFPAARIKKIMQLDDDVGRVASSVPIVISRAVEMFLQALLTKASGYAGSRNAKTLTVGHIKHCIENEKQWDFLRDLTAKVPDISVCNETEDTPKRGRKRKNSSSKPSDAPTKRKTKKIEKSESNTESGGEDDEEETDSSSLGSSHGLNPPAAKHISEPSPLAILQKRLSNPTGSVTTPSSEPTIAVPTATKVTTPLVTGQPPSASPLMALANSLSQNKPSTLPPTVHLPTPSFASLGRKANDDDDDNYD